MYIPAILEFIVILILAVFIFRWFLKKSTRDAEATKKLEEKILNDRKENAK